MSERGQQSTVDRASSLYSESFVGISGQTYEFLDDLHNYWKITPGGEDEEDANGAVDQLVSHSRASMGSQTSSLGLLAFHEEIVMESILPLFPVEDLLALSQVNHAHRRLVEDFFANNCRLSVRGKLCYRPLVATMLRHLSLCSKLQHVRLSCSLHSRFAPLSLHRISEQIASMRQLSPPHTRERVEQEALRYCIQLSGVPQVGCLCALSQPILRLIVAQNPRLKSMCLRNIYLSTPILTEMSRLKDLQRMYIKRWCVSDELELLPQLPWKSLTIDGVYLCLHLQSRNTVDVTHISNLLAACPRLEHLTLAFVGAKESLLTFNPNQTFLQITKLTMKSCYVDSLAKVLSKYFGSLTELHVAEVNATSDEILRFARQQKLTKLTIDDKVFGSQQIKNYRSPVNPFFGLP